MRNFKKIFDGRKNNKFIKLNKTQIIRWVITILVIFVFIVLPFIGSFYFSKILTFKYSLDSSKGDFSFSFESVKNLSSKVEEMDLQPSSEQKAFNDDMIKCLINEINKFIASLNIYPDMIRYNFYIKNNVSTNVTYSEKYDQEKKSGKFDFTLVCANREMSRRYRVYPVLKDLQLSDENNNDIEKVTDAIGDCITIIKGGFVNSTGRDINLYKTDENKVEGFKAKGNITVIIKPNIKSLIIIFLIFYSAWAGLIFLTVEVYRTCKKLQNWFVDKFQK